MKRLLRLSVLVMALIAILVLVTGPVAAKATRIDFTGCEYDTNIIYGDTDWLRTALESRSSPMRSVSLAW